MMRFSSEPARDYTPADIMTCALARLVKDGEAAFQGVSSHMPMIAIMLARRLHAPNAIHLSIPGGVNPEGRAAQDYTSAGGALCRDCEAIFPLSDIFDYSMRGRLDVAFLSGIQFDAGGNVNASVIGGYDHPKVRMPGGAGSAVLIPTVKRAVLWRARHDRRTFVEHVDFVTTRGNIDRIVTPLCVFKYADGRLSLDSVHPFSSFDEVQDNTGFILDRNGAGRTPPPTLDEMRTLYEIDPDTLRSIEF
jgi:glutaconate CoA-transferase subunit B